MYCVRRAGADVVAQVGGLGGFGGRARPLVVLGAQPIGSGRRLAAQVVTATVCDSSYVGVVRWKASGLPRSCFIASMSESPQR